VSSTVDREADLATVRIAVLVRQRVVERHVHRLARLQRLRLCLGIVQRERPRTGSRIHAQRAVVCQVDRVAIQCRLHVRVRQRIRRRRIVRAKGVAAIRAQISTHTVGRRIVLRHRTRREVTRHRQVVHDRDRDRAIAFATANALDRYRNLVRYIVRTLGRMRLRCLQRVAVANRRALAIRRRRIARDRQQAFGRVDRIQQAQVACQLRHREGIATDRHRRNTIGRVHRQRARRRLARIRVSRRTQAALVHHARRTLRCRIVRRRHNNAAFILRTLDAERQRRIRCVAIRIRDRVAECEVQLVVLGQRLRRCLAVVQHERPCAVIVQRQRAVLASFCNHCIVAAPVHLRTSYLVTVSADRIVAQHIAAQRIARGILRHHAALVRPGRRHIIHDGDRDLAITLTTASTLDRHVNLVRQTIGILAVRMALCCLQRIAVADRRALAIRRRRVARDRQHTLVGIDSVQLSHSTQQIGNCEGFTTDRHRRNTVGRAHRQRARRRLARIRVSRRTQAALVHHARRTLRCRI
uniref:NAD-specific glutamate dehydrogenase n=1 Tax=Parastrongyloides trichosuri TaxID=131310 RepID=A0A0N4Z3P4_PARTI